MGDLVEYVLVFLFAATPWFEIAAVIPLGIVWGLQPIPVVILSLIGNLSTIILVVYLFDKIKNYLAKKKVKVKENKKRHERAKKIWNKYGLPGLSLLGPILIGSHITIFIGMSLGASRNWALLWMTISLVLWATIFGIAAFYGVETFKVFVS